MKLLSSLESIVHLDDKGEVDTLENTSLSHSVIILLLTNNFFFFQDLESVMDLSVLLLDEIYFTVGALSDYL